MSPALSRLVSRATSDLFLAHGVRLTLQPHGATPGATAVPDAELTGAVMEAGFGPSATRLLLSTSFDLVASCHPNRARETFAAKSAADWLYVRDWTRELTNQLSGRISNRLAAYGMSTHVGSPRALSGPALTSELRRCPKPTLHFISDRGEIDVCFTATLNAEVEAALLRGAPTEAATEGSMVWFDDERKKT